MCGIVAFNGPATLGKEFVLHGLKSLSYRGADSYGVAWLPKDGSTVCGTHWLGGELQPEFTVGGESALLVGHNRWATSGEVGLKYAQPTIGEGKTLAIAFNGAINSPEDMTDGEYLYEEIYFSVGISSDKDPSRFITKTLKKIVGDFAIVILIKGWWGFPYKIFGFRRNMPLYIDDGRFSSDQSILGPFASLIPENELVELPEHSEWVGQRPWGAMLNSNRILRGNLDEVSMLDEINTQVGLKPDRIPWFECTIIACGSSYNAAKYAKCFDNDIKGVRWPTSNPKIQADSLRLLYISQSAETKDLLNSARQAIKELPLYYIHLLTNHPEGSLAQIMDQNPVFKMNCGPELSVPSTKAYTATVLSLLGGEINNLWANDSIPDKVRAVAKSFTNGHEESRFNKVFILGESELYPIAVEIALKIKECANLCVWPLWPSEIKHGDLTMVDEKTLCIFLYQSKGVDFSNHPTRTIWEIVKTRHSENLLLSDNPKDIDIYNSILVKEDNTNLFGLYYVFIMQLLSYHLGLSLGLNPNSPKSLAKSVTV